MRAVPALMPTPMSTEVDTWSFYISSCRSGAGKCLISNLNVQFVEKLGMFYCFIAQRGDQIQAGGPVGVTAPFGQGRISRTALRAEGEQRRQQQGTIGSHS